MLKGKLIKILRNKEMSSMSAEAAPILKMSSNSDKAAVGMGSLTLISLIVILGLIAYQIIPKNGTPQTPMTPEEIAKQQQTSAVLGKTMMAFGVLFAVFSFGTCVAAFAGHGQRKLISK